MMKLWSTWIFLFNKKLLRWHPDWKLPQKTIGFVPLYPFSELPWMPHFHSYYKSRERFLSAVSLLYTLPALPAPSTPGSCCEFSFHKSLCSSFMNIWPVFLFPRMPSFYLSSSFPISWAKSDPSFLMHHKSSLSLSCFHFPTGNSVSKMLPLSRRVTSPLSDVPRVFYVYVS